MRWAIQSNVSRQHEHAGLVNDGDIAVDRWGKVGRMSRSRNVQYNKEPADQNMPHAGLKPQRVGVSRAVGSRVGAGTWSKLVMVTAAATVGMGLANTNGASALQIGNLTGV